MNVNSNSLIPANATVAVIGAGVIGASWAALFLSAGHRVRVYDPAPETGQRVKEFITDAWPTLAHIRRVVDGWQQRLTLHESPVEAVSGAAFVQESLPERLNVKHEVFRAIEPVLGPHTIVASSSSGLLLSDMQQGWRACSRFILGHPFNPPHLIPLVELLGNARTAGGTLDLASAFYTSLGKVPITVNKEVPGHVANRLQAALWREAINLVVSGVATVADVDKAITAGPGLRWAVMGPHMLFNLGGGDGGMTSFCQRYRDPFHTWWDSLGAPLLTDEVREALVKGVDAEADGRTLAELAKERDQKLLRLLVDVRT
jgi:3-hydroxybutyryl-CoA dehydrogenase